MAINSLIKWIKVQHYRFEINFGFYFLTPFESFILYLIFFLVLYVVCGYSITFCSQVAKLMAPN